MALKLKKPHRPIDKTEALASWLEQFKIPSGISRGKPYVLHDFQRDVIDDHLANDEFGSPLHRTVLFSIARKNGKTSMCAALALAYLTEGSPLHLPGWRGAIASPSENHSLMLALAIQELCEANGLDHIKVRKNPAPGVVLGDNNSRLEILSGSKTQGHGLSLDFALVDEAGLLTDNSEVIQNLTDSLAARDGRLIITGTRGTSKQFNERIERPSRSTKVHCWSAPLDADPGDRDLWEKVNPGLASGIKSRRFLEDAFTEAEAAGTTTAFMAWQLNAPLDPQRQLLLEYKTLQRAYDEAAEPISGEPVWLGLDLGGAASMTAAVAVFESGVVRAVGAFPSADMNLLQRGKRDLVGMTWVQCAERGELKETTGHVTELSEFIPHVLDMIRGHPVQSVTGDRYREGELRNALAKAGVDWPLNLRANGPKDGNADILATRRMFLAGKAKLCRNLLLEASLAEADCKVSTTGAVQLDRAHRDGRNDVAAALILAAGAYMRDREAPKPEYEVEVF